MNIRIIYAGGGRGGRREVKLISILIAIITVAAHRTLNGDMSRPLTALCLLLLAASPAPAQAEDRSDRELRQQDEIDALRRQLAVVVDEVTRLRAEMGVPATEPLEGTHGAHGMGPAASKVYGATRGISLGGYAEAVYRNRVGDASGDGDDVSDFTRAVLYVGYKFSDRLVFNSEIEFEHASTSEAGSVSVEMATLDFLLRPELNLRAGLMLLPMGLVNEVHEPPFYFGTQRPEVERRIIPSTWRENGIGIFGDLGEELSYRVYVVNGLDASGFGSSGLRGGRQKGSETLAEDLGVVARLDWHAADGLELGASVYSGDSGHDQMFTQPGMGPTVKLPATRTTIWEAHADWRSGPWRARALYAQAHLDDARDLSRDLALASGAPVAEEMIGGYGEVGLDLLQWLSPGSELGLEAFFRFEYLDTQHEVPSGFTRDRSQPRRLFIPGLQFRPHPNVVLKLDYRNIDPFTGNTADEISLGMGLVF